MTQCVNCSKRILPSLAGVVVSAIRPGGPQRINANHEPDNDSSCHFAFFSSKYTFFLSSIVARSSITSPSFGHALSGCLYPLEHSLFNFHWFYQWSSSLEPHPKVLHHFIPRKEEEQNTKRKEEIEILFYWRQGFVEKFRVWWRNRSYQTSCRRCQAWRFL